MSKKIAIIGNGNVGGALTRGLTRARSTGPSRSPAHELEPEEYLFWDNEAYRRELGLIK